MTAAEYRTYEETVNTFLHTEGVRNLSCGEDCCPSFSWTPCDCCKSPLGGSRHEMTAYHEETKQVLEFSICEDCVYYSAYGRLDDTTMMELEN
jgi:hypothetical protein